MKMNQAEADAVERELAYFVQVLDWDGLPSPVQRQAVRVLADCVAVAAGGLQVPRQRRLAEELLEAAPGPSTVVGMAAGVEPGYATLVHGTAGTELELDEGHRFTAGHPGIHVVPAAMALSEALGASGRELLVSVVAGYEAAARAAQAMGPLPPALHPHGTWGAIGAAAACARLMGLSAEGILQAMRTAAHFSLNTSLQSAIEGATVRQSYAGMAGMAGLIAARLARAGFTGLDSGLARSLGQITGSFHPERLRPALGFDQLCIIGNYFKIHSACRHLHGALDAVDRLVQRLGPALLNPNGIEAIEVETYAAAASLASRRPFNGLQARFSLPYAVAARIVYGHTGPEAFDRPDERSEALELAERVTLREDPAFTASQPALRPTRLTIRLRNGRVEAERVDLPRGDPERPLRDDELYTKFVRLVSPLLGNETTERAWSLLQGLPKADDVRPSLGALRRGRVRQDRPDTNCSKSAVRR